MRRAKALGLAGVGVSLAVGATLVAGSATTAGAAPAAKQNQQNQQARPAISGPATAGPVVPVPPGQTRFATVTCPANTSLTGGGGVTAGTRTFLIDSWWGGNTWAVGATNTGTTTSALRAYAVCATRV